MSVLAPAAQDPEALSPAPSTRACRRLDWALGAALLLLAAACAACAVRFWAAPGSDASQSPGSSYTDSQGALVGNRRRSQRSRDAPSRPASPDTPSSPGHPFSVGYPFLSRVLGHPFSSRVPGPPQSDQYAPSFPGPGVLCTTYGDARLSLLGRRHPPPLFLCPQGAYAQLVLKNVPLTNNGTLHWSGDLGVTGVLLAPSMRDSATEEALKVAEGGVYYVSLHLELKRVVMEGNVGSGTATVALHPTPVGNLAFTLPLVLPRAVNWTVGSCGRLLRLDAGQLLAFRVSLSAGVKPFTWQVHQGSLGLFRVAL
ncbi:tumor necrosis factor ligand superfamily member 9 [Rhynchocyon petersi]